MKICDLIKTEDLAKMEQLQASMPDYEKLKAAQERQKLYKQAVFTIQNHGIAVNALFREEKLHGVVTQKKVGFKFQTDSTGQVLLVNSKHRFTITQFIKFLSKP